jgi:lysophospholipase L1-like esterase
MFAIGMDEWKKMMPQKLQSLALVVFCLFAPLAWAAEGTPATKAVLPEYLEQSLLYDRNGDGALVIVAFGDSITRGVGDFVEAGEEVYQASSVEGEAGYPLRTELLLDVSVSNQGVPGERLSVRGLDRFMEMVVSTRPDLVLFLEGANDALINVTYNEYFRDVQSMINVTRAFGGEMVAITTPSPCCNHGDLLTNIISYNKALRELSVINESNIADADRAFRNTCNIGECSLMNLPEGLHPNSSGYDVVGEAVVASLLNIDLFAPEGPATLETALSLVPGTIITVPDAEPVEAKK